MKVFFRPTTQKQAHSNSGIAFIVEMLVLLLLVGISLAVLMGIFSIAHEQGTVNRNKVQAIHLASNTAERFSVDPLSVPQEQVIDDLMITVATETMPQAVGTLYSASIEVYNVKDVDETGNAEPIYALETARYLKTGDA